MKILAVIISICALATSAQAQIPDFTPQTVLIGALLHNETAKVTRLLEDGADPNEGRLAGFPPADTRHRPSGCAARPIDGRQGRGSRLSRPVGGHGTDVGRVQRDRRRCDGEGPARTWVRSSGSEPGRRDGARLGVATRRDAGSGGPATRRRLRSGPGESLGREGARPAADERGTVQPRVGMLLVPPSMAAADRARGGQDARPSS